MSWSLSTPLLSVVMDTAPASCRVWGPLFGRSLGLHIHLSSCVLLGFAERKPWTSAPCYRRQGSDTVTLLFPMSPHSQTCTSAWLQAGFNLWIEAELALYKESLKFPPKKAKAIETGAANLDPWVEANENGKVSSGPSASVWHSFSPGALSCFLPISLILPSHPSPRLRPLRLSLTHLCPGGLVLAFLQGNCSYVISSSRGGLKDLV